MPDTAINWDRFAARVQADCIIKTPVWCDEDGQQYGGDEGILLEFRPFGCIDHLQSDTLLLFPEHELRDVNLRIQEINSDREDYIDATAMLYLIDGRWLTFDELMRP